MIRNISLTLIILAFIVTVPSLLARTWTNNKGKKMEAKLVKISLTKKTIKLKKAKTGKIIEVPLNKLSAEDQEYVHNILNKKQEASDPRVQAERKMFWLIALAIGNIPIYFLIGMVFFKGWADFFECVRFWLTPNIISMFRGEYMEDMLAEWKLAFFLIICGLIVFSEFFVLFKYIL